MTRSVQRMTSNELALTRCKRDNLPCCVNNATLQAVEIHILRSYGVLTIIDLLLAMRSTDSQQQAFCGQFKPISGISHEIESRSSQRRKQQLRRVARARRCTAFLVVPPDSCSSHYSIEQPCNGYKHCGRAIHSRQTRCRYAGHMGDGGICYRHYLGALLCVITC